MRQYKGYKYQLFHGKFCDFYTIYNEENRAVKDCFSLAEVHQTINDKLEYGYWVY